jgi:hypothetical protein
MAVHAVEILIRDSRNERPEQAPHVHIAIPSRFTVRQSTAPPPELSHQVDITAHHPKKGVR